MTIPEATPAQPVYTAPAYTAEDARPRRSGAAIASLILGAIFFLGLVLFRVANPLLTLSSNVDRNIITALGYFGLGTIVLVLVVVILGHIGVAATRPGRKRGRGVAGAGLALGYGLVAIYASTLVAAAIATAQPHAATFVQNVFNWV